MPSYVRAKASRFLRALYLCTALLMLPLYPSAMAADGYGLPRFVQSSAPQLSAQFTAHVVAHQTAQQAHRFANALIIGPEALEHARQALREAYPARARYLASRVVAADDEPSAERMRALHLAGYAAWLSKDFERARNYLETAEEESHEEDLLTPWRRAWLADAHFRLGNDQAAIRWSALSQENSQRYLPLHLARAISARAHARDSEAPAPRILSEFLDHYPEYPEYRDARAELALAWLAVGNHAKAAEEIDQALQLYPWAPQADRLRRALNEHPALQPHMPTYSFDERLERAREWRLLRQWPSAEAALLDLFQETTVSSPGLSDHWGPVLLELARNAMEEGNYALAHQRFQELDAADWPEVSAWEGLRDYGWNLARLHQHNEALEILRRAAKTRGDQGGTDSLFEYLYDFGHFSEARELLPSVSRTQRPDAFTTIMMTYLSSDYERAARELDALASRSNLHQRMQANYWAARAEIHMGKVVSARQRLEEIVAARPHDYYGLLAASRLADLHAENQTEDDVPGTIRLRRKPGYMHWTGSEASHAADFRVVAEQAPTMTAYSPELPPAADLQHAIEAWSELFPDLERALALFEIGADEEARQVFRRTVLETTGLRSAGRTPSRDRPLQLSGDLWAHWTDNRPTNKRGWWGYPLITPAYEMPSNSGERRELAQRQREILDAGSALTDALITIGRHFEDHHVVRRLVQRERGLSGNPPTTGPRENWLEAYPRPFPSTILSQTRRANLNPYLLWALIIVESDMNPDAISRADAYGLTQVIPKTGDRLAWELGDTSFGIHDLLDPHVSIRYGAWYFGGLVHKFHNQESLALIGYNAGPHRVARWLDWRGAELDYDEFLEMIPFPGARNYHKRILRYAATYQMLYEDELQIYIGLDLETDYDPTINF